MLKTKTAVNLHQTLENLSKIGIIALIAVVIFALAGNQAVILSMNVTEFADVFTKPLMFALIGGVTLASIALLRVNAINRSSIFWFAITSVINMMNRGPQDQIQQTVPNFSDSNYLEYIL